MLKIRKYEIPAQPEGKTAEQIMKEFKDAQEQFIEKLSTLLYWGNYPLSYIGRNFRTNEVDCAHIDIGDYAFIALQNAGDNRGVTITMRLSQNPLNPALFDFYDRMKIKRDLESARERLAELEDRYRELFPDGEPQEPK